MAGRWSVWKDEAIRKLAERCVPAADEVWRLQRSDDPEARFFQAFADGAHYRGEGGTRQGIYVVAPDGRLLSSVNSLDPEVVRGTIEEGLRAWDELDADARRPADTTRFSARSRWEDAYPEGGLVLRATIRDLPVEEGAERVPRYNLDHVWMTADEVRSALPDRPERGDVVEWPELAGRLAQFHLVDSALGQTLPYASEEILHASLSLTVSQVRDGVAHMLIVGATRADADGEWRLGDNDWTPEQRWPRTMSVELLGRARYRVSEQRFESFFAVGVGEWTGRTEVNGRGDRKAGRIGFVFELAEDTPTERVAPAFVDVYPGS